MKKIIVRFETQMLVFNTSENVVFIGSHKECDIVIDHFPTTISLFLADTCFRLMPTESNNKLKFSDWEKSISYGETIGNKIFHIHVHTFEIAQAESDWDFKKLPKNPKGKTYLKDLLQFIQDSLQIDQIALFKKVNDNLIEIMSSGLRIQDKTTFMMNNLLEENPEENIIHVQANTHSLIFKDISNTKDFTLIKNAISDHFSIVLYLTNPTNKNISSSLGKLSTLLFLFSHGISLHLAYQKNQFALKEIEEHDVFFWGKNLDMQKTKKVIDRLIFNDLSLLITGESGTGKEMIARYISQKSGKKLIAINCSAIPKDLAESFLFGHKKGSFTGAIKDQIGKIEEANNHILFLDEVAELSPEIQAKLLRVLQEKKLTPIGGKEISVNFRLICATHKELENLVHANEFRNDLYFRINEMPIRLPKLAERKTDLIDLANYLLNDICQEYNLPKIELDFHAQEHITKYDWPGNIRELKNVLKRSALISDGTDFEIIQTNKGLKAFKAKNYLFERAKENFIKNHLDEVLAVANNNKSEAAKLMGVPLRTFFRMLSTYTNAKNGTNDQVDIEN